MKNLKIRSKLYVGFGIVLVLLFILGIISIMNIGKLNRVVAAYDQETVPNVENIWSIRFNMISVERYLTEAIATPDRDLTLELLDTAMEERKRLQETIDNYNNIAKTDPKLMQEFENKLGEAAGYREEIFNLLKQEHSDENDIKALSIFENSYVPAFESATESLLKVLDDVNRLTDLQRQTAESTGYFARSIVFFVTIFSAIVTFLIIFLIRRSIERPISEIEEVAQQLALGNLNVELAYESKDEMGILAESLRQSTSSIRSYVTDISMVMQMFSEGNFDIPEPSNPFIGDFKVIEDSVRKTVAQISNTLSQINSAAEQVLSGSEQVSQGAQALAEGAVDQANSVEELSASISEITGQISLNAENAQKASTMANGAADAVGESNVKMQDLLKAMMLIEEKSREIGNIIKAIEDIAFQTNLLSLNVAVEAARAGDAGKGFVVVAEEVRKLASKSAEATKSTKELIETSIRVINEGVRLTEITAKDLIGVVEGTKQATSVIEEISKATNDQAQAITQVSGGVDLIASVVESNSATSEESAAASEELASQANLLKDLISEFKIKTI